MTNRPGLTRRHQRSCPFCGSSSSVRAERVIQGPASQIVWACVDCDTSWPRTRDRWPSSAREGLRRPRLPIARLPS